MRIHELLEQEHALYLQELNESFTLDELSFYRYKPTKSPQLKCAVKTGRRANTRIKKNASKTRSPAQQAARQAQQQSSVLKKQQAAQTAKSAATPYIPIKYPKQLVMPRKTVAAQQPPVQQPKPTPAPASLTTPNHGTTGLINLGAQAHMILPKDKRGLASWDIDNS